MERQNNSRPRFDGVAAWMTLSVEQQAEIGAIALELSVASHGTCVYPADDGQATKECRLLARIFDAAETQLCEDLLITISETLPEFHPEPDEADVPIPSRLGPICRNCGCSELDACEGGCSWVEPDLCSACADAS